MMVTRDDLKVIESERDDFTKRDVVEYGGKNFIVASHDAEHAEGPEAFLVLLLGLPEKETYVMPAVLDAEFNDWVPAVECDETCESGVCNKRVWTNTDTADIDLGYKGLLDYLNA